MLISWEDNRYDFSRLNPDSLLVNRGIFLTDLLANEGDKIESVRDYSRRIAVGIDQSSLSIHSANDWEPSEIIFDLRRNLLVCDE